MKMIQRMICELTSHRWPLDTGVCNRCGEVCSHKLAIIDPRWRRAMCSECLSLMPPRNGTTRLKRPLRMPEKTRVS